MIGKNALKISESEKVIKMLTGQVGADKKTIINAIAKLRVKGDFNKDIKILGEKLYEILLDNGLNESDIINIDRLLDKVDGYSYEKQFDKAIEILEVLDSQQYFVSVDEKKQKIYYVGNFIEGFILKEELSSEKVKNINWVLSARSVLLNQKTQMLLNQGKTKEAEALVKYILSINPADFTANLFKATFLKKNLVKYKAQIFKSYDYAYSNSHLIEIYKQLSNFYELNKNYVSAYYILNAIAIFDSTSLVAYDLDRLEIEINKTSYEKFKKPNSDQIIRFLKRENIPFTIKENVFDIICNGFALLLTEEEDNIETIEFCRKLILELTDNDTDFVKSLEKVAKAEKGGK